YVEMPAQATLWRYLKRDSSSISDKKEDSGFSPPNAKRIKSSNNISMECDEIFSPLYRSPPSSVHKSSRTLSSPSLSKMDCDDSQMILDCGQKRFGPELCPTCGMFYTPTNAQDVMVHERYHRELAAPSRFNRRIGNQSIFTCIQEFEDGFIYKC